ncbi:hypothetical protein JEZ13_12025 [bacterium]|nr:hypothetical protein [bacterium]
MIQEIKAREIPDPLLADELSFYITNILENSLYYPSCKADGYPIKYLAGNVHSFVYADYGVSKESFEFQMQKELLGYHLKHQEVISQHQHTPKGWKVMVKPDYQEMRSMKFQKSFMKKPTKITLEKTAQDRRLSQIMQYNFVYSTIQVKTQEKK